MSEPLPELSFTVDGLGEWFARIDERLDAIEHRLDELTPSVGWYDIPGAAAYLSMSADAVKKAESTGKLVATRTASGRVRFERSALDAYARGDGQR